MTISIYDMDRTLTRRGTWTAWLKFWLRHEAPWRVVFLPLLLGPALAFEAGIIDRGALQCWSQRIVMGGRVHRTRVASAAARFAQAIVAGDVFPAAKAAIAADRAAGRRLAIATASNAYYAAAIGEALGIDDVIATQLQWDGAWLLPLLDGPNCYGDGKAEMIGAWLEARGLTGAPWRFRSDHISDLPVFEMAVASGGAAIAVNPSAALRAEALRRDWPVIDWGVPEPSLLEHA